VPVIRLAVMQAHDAHFALVAMGFTRLVTIAIEVSGRVGRNEFRNATKLACFHVHSILDQMFQKYK
jgi:hypothetical protein